MFRKVVNYTKRSNLRRRGFCAAKDGAVKEESFLSMIPLKYMVIIAPTAIISCCAISLHVEPWRDYLEEKYPSLIKFAREYIDFEDAFRLVENVRIAAIEAEAAKEVQAMVTFDNGNSVIIEGVQGNIPYSKFEEGITGTLSSGQVNTNTGKIVSIEFLDAVLSTSTSPTNDSGVILEQQLVNTSAGSSQQVTSRGCPMDLKSVAGGNSSSKLGAGTSDGTPITCHFTFDNATRSLWDESRGIAVDAPSTVATGSKGTVVSSVNGGVVTISKELAEADLCAYVYGGKYTRFLSYQMAGLAKYREYGTLDTTTLRYKPGRCPQYEGGTGSSDSGAGAKVEAEQRVQLLSEQIDELEHELRQGSRRPMDDIQSAIVDLQAQRSLIRRKHLNWFYFF